MNEVNWNDAPQWAEMCGVVGPHHRGIWYNHVNYAYVDEPEDAFEYGGLGYVINDITHIADKPTTANRNKYERDLTDSQGNSATVDVYDVLHAFNVTCPATQHAIKKLLCTGVRGHKDGGTDLLEAREAITRAIELRG